MSENKITRGVLSGFEVDQEDAKVIGELAEKLDELNNGELDPEEETLAKLFGAEAKPKDAVDSKDVVPEGSGSKVADQGVLTGVDVDEKLAQSFADVAETIEDLEEYEKPINEGQVSRDDSEMNNIGETLAVVMGVESQAKKPGEI